MTIGGSILGWRSGLKGSGDASRRWNVRAGVAAELVDMIARTL